METSFMREPDKKESKDSLSAAALSVKGRSLDNPVMDNSYRIAAQAKLHGKLFGDTIQRKETDEKDVMQGKFKTRHKSNQNAVRSTGSNTGIPENVQAKMERAFNTGFSNVKVHPNSSKATEMGALAYTQGQDIHFAPGRYNPASSSGQKLLGHELAHVVQQSQGRVKATSEVAGVSLNDNPMLEKEADEMGSRAFSSGSVYQRKRSEDQ